jgi:hypothetical protein
MLKSKCEGRESHGLKTLNGLMDVCVALRPSGIQNPKYRIISLSLARHLKTNVKGRYGLQNNHGKAHVRFGLLASNFLTTP